MAKLYQRPLEPDFCYDRRRECEKSCGKMICDSDAYRALKGRMQYEKPSLSILSPNDESVKKKCELYLQLMG